jgi:aromatic ring-opening dioxygenase catalytic subunit (LigB family)
MYIPHGGGPCFFMKWTRGPEDASGLPSPGSERFDAWLTAAVESSDPSERDRKLCLWSDAPHALECHPRSEHLTPLFVAAGAAKADRGRRTFSDHIFGHGVSGFQFG